MRQEPLGLTRLPKSFTRFTAPLEQGSSLVQIGFQLHRLGLRSILQRVGGCAASAFMATLRGDELVFARGSGSELKIAAKRACYLRPRQGKDPS